MGGVGVAVGLYGGLDEAADAVVGVEGFDVARAEASGDLAAGVVVVEGEEVAVVLDQRAVCVEGLCAVG